MATEKTHLERLLDVLGAVYPEPGAREIPFLVSICYYSIALLMGRILRSVIRQHAPDRLRPYLLDIVTTFQMMACSLENSQIMRFYGPAAYVAIMFVLLMWSSVTVKDSSGNPCSHVLRYMHGAETAWQCVAHIACQLAGGLASYPAARQFWSLGLHEGHRVRYAAVTCSTSLHVPVTLGFGVEFAATMFDILTALVVLTPFELYEEGVKGFFGCLWVVFGALIRSLEPPTRASVGPGWCSLWLGILGCGSKRLCFVCCLHLTGMYCNPINATNQSFGCSGSTNLEHFIVYWVAPLSATAASVKLHSLGREVWKSVVSGSVHDVTPELAPDVTSELVPDVTPELANGVSQDKIPQPFNSVQNHVRQRSRTKTH